MKRLRVMSVFGTRPEAIKMAPVVAELASHPAIESQVLVTAQHREMLDQVLEHFGIVPDYDLNIMQEGQRLEEITCRVLEGASGVLGKARPDLVLVHGDTTTTFASALAAFYRGIAVGHVEAGLRTRDKFAPFPEEINRHLTAVLADLHFAPTPGARDNLLAEGVAPERIWVTGNTAIDALLRTVSPAYSFRTPLLRGLDFAGRRVLLVEAHRRENWNGPMERICRALLEVVRRLPETEIVYSVHRNPQVAGVVRRWLEGEPRVHLVEPLPYPEWANLMARAYLVVTDSGGLQEEAPALGRPVVLLRDTTERPEALVAGTVRQVGTSVEQIVETVTKLVRDGDEYARMARAVNPFGDGRAAKRIVGAIAYHYGLTMERPEEFAL